MNMYDTMKMIEKEETPEQYKKREMMLDKYLEERDRLQKEISMLRIDPKNDKEVRRKLKRMEVVRKMIKKYE